MAFPMEVAGQTRENPLPWTKPKVKAPVIPYSQLLAGDEEDEILNWTSLTNPDKVQQLKKAILEHSKEMNGSLLLLTKANHQRAVLRESLRTTS